MSERTGIYPGTFDPVTNGHMDIISRASRVVDTLIVGVATNAGKSPLFSLDEVRDLVETLVVTEKMQREAAQWAQTLIERSLVEVVE